MDRVVVFGGSGFIGSHVADELTLKGFDVVLFDKVTSPYLRGNQSMVVGELLDRSLVRQVVNGARYVYHFAGLSDIGASSRMPWETMQANVMGTCAVLEACKAREIERFVFASSMHARSELGSIYGVSKQAGEKLVEAYGRAFGMPYTIVRIGTPYGPRANAFNPIRKMVDQAWHEGRIDCNGTPDEMRACIHVADVARVCVQVLEEGYRNRYAIAAGTEVIDLGRLIRTIREMLHREVAVAYHPRVGSRHLPETPYAYQPPLVVTVSPTHQVGLGQGLLGILYECGGSEAGTFSAERDHGRDGLSFGGWGLMAPEWAPWFIWLCDALHIAARGWAHGTAAGIPNNSPRDRAR